MRLPPQSGLVWILLLWTFLFHSPLLRAASDAQPDTRVLIDISGSMKQSDPDNLRIPALKLLVNLAPEGSRFGVWSFGQWVNNLVPVDTVTPQWKQQAAVKADRVTSTGLYTNIGLALERASQGQLKPDPDWQRTLVLLSDGKVDISKDPLRNQQEKQRILKDLLPTLKKAGFRIHSVALSDQADDDFLKTLSLETGGTFSEASRAEELLEVFVETSDRVHQPDQVPLTDNRFSIDASINEFTVLVFRKAGSEPARLIAPDGTQYRADKGSPNISWFADPSYDLITVYNPAPGGWQIQASIDPLNRVTVVSDLSVEMSGLPENALAGENLVMKMHLEEKGRVITNPTFLKLMDITFRQDAADGETFEGKLANPDDAEQEVPEDGVFSARLGRTIKEGEQEFSIVLDGKTFKRKKSRTVTVHSKVLEVETQYRDDDGQLLSYLSLTPVVGLTNPEDIRVVAQITDPQGEKSLQNAVYEAGKYRIDVPATAEMGVYEALVKVSGTSLNGHPFELIQGPFRIDYTPVSYDPENTRVTGEPETFDESAMEIPSLDVEELPPDDMLADELEINSAAETATEAEIAPEQDDATAFNWMWVAIAAGNLVIIALGVFFYIKFLRKTDAEQKRVVEEIEEIQHQKKQQKEKQRTEAETEKAAEQPEPDPEPEQEQSEPTPPPAPESTDIPESPYVNETPPLELEEDEHVEVDDDFALDDPKKN